MSTEEFQKRKTLEGVSKDLLTPLRDNPIPKEIGPYIIESLLEKGGMSLLYLGLHPENFDVTTIKVLSPKFLIQPEIVQRFLKEAEIIGMMNHPNIVKLYSHGEWEEGFYIAMEFIQGKSLRQTLLNWPIALKRALEIIVDIAYALCHLHTHGVIHRDLKPENVLITEEGEVKVIDFGIAQMLNEKSSIVNEVQKVIGTPIYMSPEQRDNPELVSYPSDIYSLGIIAYELILGRLSHGIIHIALMPKGIQKILSKCLQPNPLNRYQDVVDFITDVLEYLHSTNLEKEKKPGDHLNEISENLCNIQDILIPSTLPDWLEIEMYVGRTKGVNIFGVYYDYFNFSEGSYGIIMGESFKKGAEGVVCAAMLRGMTQTCIKQSNDPIQLITNLNKLISSDIKNGLFAFNYILFKPKENLFQYISCGHNSLWVTSNQTKEPLKLTQDHKLLGEVKEAVFTKIDYPWNMGDSLVLTSFSARYSEENSDAFFERVLRENRKNQSAKKNVEAILRKAKNSIEKSLKEKPLSLIWLLRRSI